MLIQPVELQFSAYSSLYNLIVPKENLLWKINDLIDFSFVYNELVTKYCHNNERAAKSPIRMFKYLLLKTRILKLSTGMLPALKNYTKNVLKHQS